MLLKLLNMKGRNGGMPIPSSVLILLNRNGGVLHYVKVNN